jgi:hypothetical protein
MVGVERMRIPVLYIRFNGAGGGVCGALGVLENDYSLSAEQKSSDFVVSLLGSFHGGRAVRIKSRSSCGKLSD